MPRLDAGRLPPLLHSHLLAAGACEDGAAHVVASLMQTSLRGVDSHGIQLFPHYWRATRSGRIRSRPAFAVTRTAPGTAVFDADHAFGHHAGALAIDLASQLAEEAGIGAVSVRHSSHFGAAAYFALRPAGRGQIGMAFTNADALVKAFRARQAVFGTNPICFTAPLAEEEPLCLDMATSTVSWNKIRIHREAGGSIPADWAFDADGLPTTDPHLARSLNPAGTYKGYGLGMMVEILCGLLADGPIGREILPMFSSPIEAQRNISHFFLALDIRRFVDSDRFRQRLQSLVNEIRAMPALEQTVMVPGDPEKRCAAQRLREGIPVTETVWASFLEISSDFEAALLP